MSIRRGSLGDDKAVLTRPSLHESVAPTGTTISDQLGLPNVGPANPYVPFKPQHPMPQPVGNVVDGVFSG